MIRKITKKIFQKKRVKEYENILKYALTKNYKLVSLIDWYKIYRNTNEKILILRHDVDYDTKGAYNFYKIEKKLNAKSTFYFRWKTMNKRIMNKMHNNSFEVSLHFETLATYAKKNNLFKKEQITKDVIDICKKNLSKEIELFEKNYFKINTICSHGDKRNRILDIPNHVLITKDFYTQHNILFETYDQDITQLFDSYISDSSIYSNFEWKHSGSPYKMIDEQKQTICLLTHPIHWNQSFFKNINMIWKIYFDNI
jgi:hypothetical protein